jgi:hypothetical protein
MKNILATLVIFGGLVFCCHAYQVNNAAQTITTDGSYADTSQALAYISGQGQDGWVVTVGSPGGVYTWTNTLPYGAGNSVIIQGASPTSRPQIMINTAGYSGIFISATSPHVVTIKDLIFNWTGTQPVGAMIALCGTGVCFRLSNCQFLGEAASKFVVQVGNLNSTPAPGPFGVIDHCQFLMPFNDTFNLINVRANGGVVGYGWTQPMTWGTTNSVVVEDCQFSAPSSAPVGAAVEADSGARFTVRNCCITNIPISTHGVASGAKDSTLQVECYNNQFYINDSKNTMPYLFWMRGGTCVVWSNNIATTGQWNLAKVFYFSVECASSQWVAESCSNHLVYPGDYPGFQQVGQGVVNGAQGSVPTYIWNNVTPWTYWGNVALGMDVDSVFIQQGRDIFTNSVMPGYTALVYPHPLVAAGGTVPSTPITTTSSGSVIPPTDLQAHAPMTNQ